MIYSSIMSTLSLLSILSLFSLSLRAAGPLDKPAALKRHAAHGPVPAAAPAAGVKRHPDTLKIQAGAEKLRRRQNLDTCQGTAVLDPHSDLAAAWGSITPTTLASIPFFRSSVSPIRGIAEVCAPRTETEARNQQRELSHFHSLGYNTVLAVWRGEKAGGLSDLIRELRKDGWQIILTYGPAESADTTAYLDPDLFRQAFALLLPDVDALLLSWRKTSPGHWAGDATAGAGEETFKAWCVKVSCLARQVRPDLPLIGELFVLPGKRSCIGWAPYCVSAVLVTNAGYQGLVPAGIAKICRTRTSAPLIGLILGPTPYYRTIYPSTLADCDIRSICTRLENRYAAEGFAGTVTLAGDGFGERSWHGKKMSDSLTQTKWSKVQKENKK